MTITHKDVDKVVKWTQDYFEKNGFKKAVIGLSGGIDSAVTCALCCEALSTQNIIAVALPCPEDGDNEATEKDLEHAQLVADKLSIPLQEVSIHGPTILMFHEVFKGIEYDHRLALGNIKARLRMTALYAIAEREKGLVVGTTNKTEAKLGYFTKYGDGGVDIEPIQDFYKTEIFEMGQLLGIPEEIVSKPPSAGLWPGQTDEGELGIAYEDIDRILESCSKRGIIASHPTYVFTGNSTEWGKFRKVQEIIEANQHKNKPIPYYKRD